jgi:hypothetical protein
MKHLLSAFLAMLALSSPCLAASVPPSFTISGGSVLETSPTITATLQKSAKASSYSKITITTIDGTAKAGVDFKPIATTLTIGNTTLSTKIAISIIARPGYQGNRTFRIHIAAARFASIAVADATITILETDPAPTPPAATWIAAPLTNGGYARCKSIGGCHSIAYPCPPLLNTTGPAFCSYPNIIANYGDVRLQAWNGIGAYPSERIVAALWPIGHDPRVTKLAADWLLGAEGWQDEWEGVAPAP